LSDGSFNKILTGAVGYGIGGTSGAGGTSDNNSDLDGKNRRVSVQ